MLRTRGSASSSSPLEELIFGQRSLLQAMAAVKC
jgi:hypothetical protein